MLLAFVLAWTGHMFGAFMISVLLYLALKCASRL